LNAHEQIRRRLLAGLAADRIPGFSFTGHFLDTTWPWVGTDRAKVTIPQGPWCVDRSGRIELTALLMTIDIALSTATRLFIIPGERLATTYLHARFTGASFEGQPVFEGIYEGASQGDAVGQLLSRAVVSSGDTALCHASASFVRLPPPPGGRVLTPLPWQQPDFAPSAPLDPAVLDTREREVLAAADAAIAASAAGDASFLRHFWGILPVPVEGGGAYSRMVTGAHTANRVGHVQGGLLMGLAAETAMAAVPRHTVLSNITAWFLSPGKGAALECTSTPIHAGRSFAVVKTEILGEGGVRVLEAVTAHATAA
jgi:acyl-coenzyme A thioesterase PaaI-like protein